MGPDTSQPACIPKVVTLSLFVEKTTCADALQPSVTPATRDSITFRTSGRLMGLPTIAICATFVPIGNYRTSGRFPEVPTSEFGHLSGIGKPAKHPRGFTIGTFVSSIILGIYSSHRFAELSGSTSNR